MSELLHISPLLQALLATLLTWGVTALGAALVLFTRRTHPLLMDALLAFGAGVMLASSYFSLLAPSIDMAQELEQLPWLVAAAGFLAGGALLLLADHIMRHLPCAGKRRSILLVSSITLHNIPEGMAVGVVYGGVLSGNTDLTLAGALALSIGMAIQNIPEGAIISVPLRNEGKSPATAFVWGAASGLVEPIAALATMFILQDSSAAMPILLAFAAGAMLYVVVEELIPSSQKGSHSNVGTIGFALGFILMMLLDSCLG